VCRPRHDAQHDPCQQCGAQRHGGHADAAADAERREPGIHLRQHGFDARQWLGCAHAQALGCTPHPPIRASHYAQRCMLCVAASAAWGRKRGFWPARVRICCRVHWQLLRLQAVAPAAPAKLQRRAVWVFGDEGCIYLRRRASSGRTAVPCCCLSARVDACVLRRAARRARRPQLEPDAERERPRLPDQAQGVHRQAAALAAVPAALCQVPGICLDARTGARRRSTRSSAPSLVCCPCGAGAESQASVRPGQRVLAGIRTHGAQER
jgi:hypothetical protein